MIKALNGLFRKASLKEDASPAEIEQAVEAGATEIQATIDQLTHENEGLSVELSEAKKTVEAQTASIQALEAQIETLRAEVAEATEAKQAAIEQLAGVQSERDQAIEAKAAAEKLAAEEIAKAHAAPAPVGGANNAAEFNEAFQKSQKSTFPRVASTTY